MPSIFALLNTSRRALDAGQLGVQIANHNIANVNTPGYTRQELVLSPMRTLLTPFGEMGVGVRVDQVRRVTDEFLTAAMYRENSDLADWQTAADILGRVEMLTGVDDETSLSNAITEFFNAFDQLATNVEDNAVRTVVVNAGRTLAERFNGLAASLGELGDEIDARIEQQSQEVSEILRKIADLNNQVIAKDTHEVKSNDLKVRRAQLLEQLSQYVKFSTREDQYGALDVYIAGRQVVHRDSWAPVETTDTVAAGSGIQPLRVAVDGVDLAAERIGGSLGSLLRTRDTELASAREALDRLAGTIADRVNALHTSGFSPAGSGVAFFTGNDAASIAVNEVLVERPEYVAHSYNNTPGDNRLARDIAALRDTELDELGGRTPVGFFSALVGDVGSLSRSAQTMRDNKQLTRSELQTRIESVSGVSLDEEAANVTRYQTMYEAAARMMGTINEMLDTLVTLGGV